MKTTRWVLAAAILASASGASADERPTAEELLTAFEKSVEKLARVRIEWKDEGPERKQPDGKSQRGMHETTVFRDGPRWKVDLFRQMTTTENGTRSESKSRDQTLVGEEIIDVTQFERGPGDPAGPVHVIAYRDERTANRTWLLLGPCRVLFGRMGGDAGLPLWSVMREAASLELLPQTEIVAGVETYVLKSRGKYGEHQLWLDPASGGLPRRIEIHKQAGNLFNDEQLGTSPAPDPEAPPDRRRPAPLPARREYSSRIDKIQIEQKDGVFVITGFVDEFSVTYATGKKREDRTEFKVRAVEINPKDFPENAFRFDIVIPNGTSVSVLENFPLEYQGRIDSKHEWVEGKIRERLGK
jgi:hypothetical protein